jgi:hypothetical protein
MEVHGAGGAVKLAAAASDHGRMSRILACLTAFLLAAPPAAAAEPLTLTPRFQPGDARTLSLSTTTDTASLSGATEGRRSSEAVRLTYHATVTVLEVDEDGRPRRERHEHVQLAYERPEGSGSLFQPGASFEARRGKRGGWQLFAGERRLDRRVEQVATALLESQLEHTLLPALLDPGRPVTAGETWELDRRLAKRLLKERGLRVIEFGAPATATLLGETDGPRRLAYRIPVEWVELTRMPPDTRTAASVASLEGEIALGADGRALGHTANLAVRMNGALVKTGVSTAVPWRLESSRLTAQRTQPLERVVVSGL